MSQLWMDSITALRVEKALCVHNATTQLSSIDIDLHVCLHQMNVTDESGMVALTL